MSLEFKRLSDVDIVEEISDDTYVLIEENETIKKVPKKGVGSAIPTAIIKNPDYDACMQWRISGEASDYSLRKTDETETTEVSEQDVNAMLTALPECINMTFEEVFEIVSSGGLINVILQDIDYSNDLPFIANCTVSMCDDECMMISYLRPYNNHGEYQWYSDGLDSMPI